MDINVVISDNSKLEGTLKRISQDGPEKFHVLADFDNTLSKSFINGKVVPSMISILRDGNYLTPDYAGKAHALFDKFHPMERDPKLGLAEKKEKMREWWSSHFKLLIDSGFTKKDIDIVVDSGKIQLRDGVAEFIKSLQDKNIPLVIISSSALGADPIRSCLDKAGVCCDDIHIISNVWEVG